MIDIQPDARAQRKAILDEAYRRALSWLSIRAPAWRPVDHLIQQIAPALGRDYTLEPGGSGPDSTGEAGRKALACAVLKRLVAEEGYETHTDRDGRKTFSRIWVPPRRLDAGGHKLLLNPDELRLPNVSGVVLRDLTERDSRWVVSVDETGNPWDLPNPIEVVTSPGGRGVAAVVGNKVVGYAVYTCDNGEPNKWYARVERLAVAAKWRRRGIGALLLQSVQARAVREGADTSPTGVLTIFAVTPEPCLPVQIMLRGLGYAIFGLEAVLPWQFGDADGYAFSRRLGWHRPE